MTPEALLTLLRDHQDGVYTVCLHVLRNPHDAEDAAQEALLKIASEAKNVRDPRAFKSWLYRLVFRTAVDHARRRATRRRLEEGSIPMSPAPLSDEQREAIHEAMASLPDDDRLMLVEHYFEKVTIEELGHREGVSDVAMGKRLEKAREKLKRGLAGAGILLGSSQVSSALDAVTPAIAPSGLLGTAALTAAGGAVVGTKSALTLGLAALLVLILGVGGALLIMGPERPPRTPTADSSGARSGGTIDRPDGSRPQGLAPDASTPGDARKCRQALARLVGCFRPEDLNSLVWNIESVHAGQYPLVENFIREFSDSAGQDLLTQVRALLAEVDSDTTKFLMAIVLGRSDEPASIEILKGLSAAESNPAVAASALYSLGLLRTPESLALLRSKWEEVKRTGGPLGRTVIQAMGLQGAEGMAWILEEFKDPDLVVKHQKGPWLFYLKKENCLELVRGKDAFAALRRHYESDPNPALRHGAMKGMMANLSADGVDFLAAAVTAVQDPERKADLILSMNGAPKSNSKSELADRLLSESTFPSGDAGVDQALIRLARIGSPVKAEAFFDKFIALASSSPDPQLHWNLGMVYMAVAGRPDVKDRIAALMETAGFSDEQRGIVLATGLYAATAESAEALARPVLELVRTADPKSSRFANCIQPLLLCGIKESDLSAVLEDLSSRQTDPEDRLVILRELARYAGGSVLKTRDIIMPQTFLMATIAQAKEPESLLYAATALMSVPGEAPSELRGAVSPWLGREMRWAEHTPGWSYLAWVAPGTIGDFYARFGTSKDISWLKDLPESFPWPGEWSADDRTRVKFALKEESRRAIDAIRLRN